MSIITATAHGLAEGQAIKFGNVVPSDSGIDETATYYVIAANLTANTFSFSEVPGGAEFTLDNAITNGDIISPEEYAVLGPEEEPAAQTMVTHRDIEPPSIPGGLAATGVMKGAFVSWNPTTASDLAFFEVRYAPDDGTGTGPDVLEWTTVRCKTTTAYLGGLIADSNADGIADKRYWVQVRAVDTTGNTAPWQATAITIAAATNLITTPSAHRFVADDRVRFTSLAGAAGLAVDTDYYVISSGLTTTAFKVSATLGGAEVDVTSDSTGTTNTITGYPLYRDYSAEAESGWTVAVSVDPKLVDDGDITYQSIGTEHVKVTGLSAAVIKTGTLNINTASSSMTDGIKVYDDSNNLIGLWNETGLYIYAAADSTDYVRIYDGGLSVFVDGVEQVALNELGLNASVLGFGSLPGGHNVILNSSFELSDFAAEPSQATWTVAADWSGTNVSKTNLTEGANALSMTAATYA